MAQLKHKIKSVHILVRHAVSQRDTAARALRECLDDIENLKEKLKKAQNELLKQESITSQMMDSYAHLSLELYRQTQKSKIMEIQKEIDIMLMESENLRDKLTDTISTLKSYEQLEEKLITEEHTKIEKEEKEFLDDIASQNFIKNNDKY